MEDTDKNLCNKVAYIQLQITTIYCKVEKFRRFHGSIGKLENFPGKYFQFKFKNGGSQSWAIEMFRSTVQQGF